MITSVGRDVEKLELSTLLVGMENDATLYFLLFLSLGQNA
jgi:hypothetical protein